MKDLQKICLSLIANISAKICDFLFSLRTNEVVASPLVNFSLEVIY